MADEVSVAAPIARVELFEDRVAITRRLAPVGAGRAVLVVGDLSPLIRADALVVDAGSHTVEEVRVTRSWLTRDAADPALAQAVEAQRAALALQTREAEAAQALRTLRVSRAQAALDVAWRRAARTLLSDDADHWLAVADALHADADAAAEAHAAAAADLAGQRAALTALEHQLAAARAGAPAARSTIRLQVVCAGEEPILLRYTVPCAAWRPQHRATWVDDHLVWETGAMVWNATGEDWPAVTLALSTARPGTPAHPPSLEDDRVQVQRRPTEVVVEARDVVIAAARVGRRVDDLPGVDDGGEVCAVVVPVPVSVASDGLPVAVPLGTCEVPVTPSWRAHPERAAAVVCTTLQANPTARALLAGPVALVRHADGRAVSVGTGAIGYVGPGEPFRLCWGAHDGARVARTARRRVEAARLTGRQQVTHEVELRLANPGTTPVTVEVVERIPVSELKEVSVGAPVAQPPFTAGPDRDGLGVWQVALAPGERRVLQLRFTVEAPAHVSLPTG